MTARFREPHHTFDAALLAAGRSGDGDSGPPAPTAAEFLRHAEDAAKELLAYARRLGTGEVGKRGHVGGSGPGAVPGRGARPVEGVAPTVGAGPAEGGEGVRFAVGGGPGHEAERRGAADDAGPAHDAKAVSPAGHVKPELDAVPGGAGMAELAEAAGRFLQLAAACVPFVADAPRLAGAVRTELVRSLPDGGEGDAASAIGYPDSPAFREMRSLYRIAYGVSRDPAAREIVLELSARRTAERLSADLPEVWRQVEDHIIEHGWVRTWNTALPPLSAREAVQRMQNALLRWDPETAGVAAGELQPGGRSRPQPKLSEKLQPLAAAHRKLAGELPFSPALFTKARWESRRFWQAAAEQCGVDPGLLPWATPEEVLAALRGERPLEKAELQARQANGFSLHAAAGDVHAHARETPAEPEGVLTGQSVSLGRAVGRVKVVLNADDGGKLLPGDVLVTDLSTPTYEGQPSVFPYRGIPSVAIEKAAAVVTDEGGLLSHAAIVCRESRVPSVLGTERATSVLRDGMIVEVDATRAAGRVIVLEG
ncbi:MAG TPA: PEP-utilizing enzyme [Actinomycetota bacterium]|nr:PEP-utilizing enzyme [Actinomycetota bacterium]